jgi:hypothetical protein
MTVRSLLDSLRNRDRLVALGLFTGLGVLVLKLNLPSLLLSLLPGLGLRWDPVLLTVVIPMEVLWAPALAEVTVLTVGAVWAVASPDAIIMSGTMAQFKHSSWIADGCC